MHEPVRRGHSQDACRAPSQTPPPGSILTLSSYCFGEAGPMLSHKSLSSAYTFSIHCFPFLLFKIISIALLFLRPPPFWGGVRLVDVLLWLTETLVLECRPDLFLHLLFLCGASSLCFESSPLPLGARWQRPGWRLPRRLYAAAH